LSWFESMRGSHCKSTSYDECALQCAQENLDQGQRGAPRFINPHRLFHGVWLPQWLEERPEVSEKAKKLYAYLTYFAGGKGYSWPSFGLLGEKLHCSRRHVMRLVQELSTHGLITVTNVSNPERGHCANYYRFLSHPWMQTERDAKFVLAAVEGEPVDFLEESAPENRQADTPGDIAVTSPLVTSISPAPSDMPVTSPGDIHVTPLVTPMSPKENNKKRINYRGKVPATSSGTSPSKVHSTAAPPSEILSDTTKIVLERRVAELRREIASASKRGYHERAQHLHAELVDHQTKLGFTPDDPSPKPKVSREEEFCEPATLSDWPSPEEVRAAFNEAHRSMGWPIKR
jgi:Helix-turn-helix domain